MKLLEKLLLGIPYRLLKTIPYAWVMAIFFWSWSPVFSGILMAIVLLGLGLMAWQKRAWENSVRREFHSGEANPYIDHPHPPRKFQILYFVLVCAGSGLVGWILNGRVNLNGLQWFLLFAGFTLLSRDAVLFGAPVSYLITDQGIGIRCVPGQVDHRRFFKFTEIWKAARTKVPDNIPLGWEVLTPQRHPKEGVLLNIIRREGLSQQIRSEVLLSPTYIEGFLGELMGHVDVVQETLANPG
jgi:hypothetical protein